MSGYVEAGRVIRNERISEDVLFMEVYAPKQAREGRVGQFCNVRVTDGTAPLLRRPISYAGFDREKGTIHLLYRVVGLGTELMTRLREGDELDCLGPLGSAFSYAPRMLLVGGGVGIAPMLCAVRHKRESAYSDCLTEVVLGFRSERESFWAKLFEPYGVRVHITTDDGTLGTKGFPTAVMPDILKGGAFDTVITCGPTPMMKGVARTAEACDVPCQVSLEERMGCGTGGCLGCGCDGAGGKRYKICKDGPVFPAEEVFFA